MQEVVAGFIYNLNRLLAQEIALINISENNMQCILTTVVRRLRVILIFFLTIKMFEDFKKQDQILFIIFYV